MTVARDDLEACAEDPLDQIGVEDLEWRSLPHDPSVGERDDA